MDIRSRILVAAYKLFPFPLKGDAKLEGNRSDYDVSCVINFYGRTNLLGNILSGLSEQDLLKDRFQVILVEDRGGTGEGEAIFKEFKCILNTEYYVLRENYGKMGYSRNFGLSKARGMVILFLDDDTVILQKDFLSTLIDEFENSSADAVIPQGSASYCLIKGRYGFHDPYFPANRCMAYRREALKELGGFVSEITGQEDVEFIVRFITSGKKFHNSRKLNYLHPPLILNSFSKAAAVGASFVKLKRYPSAVRLMLLINGLRYLPQLLFPVNKKLRMQAKFSLGFLLGILYSLTGREIEYN